MQDIESEILRIIECFIDDENVIKVKWKKGSEKRLIRSFYDHDYGIQFYFRFVHAELLKSYAFEIQLRFAWTTIKVEEIKHTVNGMRNEETFKLKKNTVNIIESEGDFSTTLKRFYKKMDQFKADPKSFIVKMSMEN